MTTSAYTASISEIPPRARTLSPDLLPDPYRVWSLPRFGMVLIYNSTTTPARVIRVLSTARDLPKALENTDF